jgi:hypothetical protein
MSKQKISWSDAIRASLFVVFFILACVLFSELLTIVGTT